MKANELRIGNYIWLESKQKEYQISSGHDIEEIDDAPLNFDAQPIPLTDEWLFKFGFEKDGEDLILDTNLFLLVSYNDDEFVHLKSNHLEIIISVKYVHQLQNLYFALTGKELTFKSE